MTIESKNLLVAVKAFSRANPLPLDASEVHESFEAAQLYATSPKAYAGQTIKVLIDGKYQSYTLNGTQAPYTLSPVCADQQVAFVQIVDELPSDDPEQGVIYIVTTDNTGYIWNGVEFVVVFESIEGLTARVDSIEENLSLYAPIESPVFTGMVTLPGDPNTDLEAATKQYVDHLFEGVVSCAPGVVSSTQEIPSSYMAGQTWRVIEAGVYAGQICEVGDLLIAAEDNGEIIVVQANLTNSVSGPESAIDANIAVFDGTTGKLIKDSTISMASVTEVVNWITEHKDVLETYTMTQNELVENINNCYTKEEVENLLSEINNKVVENSNNITNLTETLGALPEGVTVQEYIDGALANYTTTEELQAQYVTKNDMTKVEADIAKAIQRAEAAEDNAKAYTDEKTLEVQNYIEELLTITEW